MFFSALERNAENRKTEMLKYRNTEEEEINILESQYFTIVKDGQEANEGETFYYVDSRTESLTELFYSPLVKSNL